MVVNYTKIEIPSMAYKLEWDEEKKEVVQRDLTPEEYLAETKYADEVLASFLPKDSND